MPATGITAQREEVEVPQPAVTVPLDVMPLVHAIIDTAIDDAMRRVAAMHEPMLANETLDEDMLSDPEVVSILAGEFAWQEVPYESQQPLWMEDADYGDGQLKQPL